MEQVRDFTQGKVRTVILQFYIPMFFTNMLQQLYNFADSAIVGNELGDFALAAVGNMGSLNFLIVGFSLGLSVGFSVLIAQYFGAKNYEGVRKSLAGSITLAVGMTILLTVFSAFFLEKALLFMHTDPSIMKDSLLYGQILFGGLFATIAYNLSAAILRAFGDSTTPLHAIIISSILNVALDYFALHILKTGVEGAAIATIIAQVLSAIICIRKICKISYAKLERTDFIPSGALYWELLKNGIPMAIMNSITAVGCMVVQYFVNDRGVYYTAAYSACSRYINLFMQPACTAGSAMSAYTSQNYGAKRFDRIWEGLKVCLGIAILSYVILGLVMHFCAYALADIFLEDAQAIAFTVQYLKICAVTIIAVDCLFIFRSGVQGMAHPLVPMLSGIAEMALRIGIIAGLCPVIGFSATAWAETGAWIGALIMNMTAFFWVMKKEGHMLKLKEERINGKVQFL